MHHLIARQLASVRACKSSVMFPARVHSCIQPPPCTCMHVHEATATLPSVCLGTPVHDAAWVWVPPQWRCIHTPTCTVAPSTHTNVAEYVPHVCAARAAWSALLTVHSLFPHGYWQRLHAYTWQTEGWRVLLQYTRTSIAGIVCANSGV